MNTDMNLTVELNGNTYPLATTLRVAFNIQGQHNHKPYAEVFSSIDTMGIEDQIGILYAAFICANPDMKTKMNQQEFTDCCLDSMNLSDLMNKLGAVAQGIMGDSGEESTENTVEGDAKNV